VELSKARHYNGFSSLGHPQQSQTENRYMLIKPAEAEQEKDWEFKVLFRNVCPHCRTGEILAALLSLGYRT